MLETIYIARHGFRASWVDPTISSSVTKMPRDPPVSEPRAERMPCKADPVLRGLVGWLRAGGHLCRRLVSLLTPGIAQEQAEDLANWMTGGPASTSTTTQPGPRPELVFSSPFYRCIQTAVPLAAKLGVEVRLEHGVMEWCVRISRMGCLWSRVLIGRDAGTRMRPRDRVFSKRLVESSPRIALRSRPLVAHAPAPRPS